MVVQFVIHATLVVEPHAFVQSAVAFCKHVATSNVGVGVGVASMGVSVGTGGVGGVVPHEASKITPARARSTRFMLLTLARLR